ncbi:MAG: phosphoribosylamine--glycine ligase [Acidimicrobiales bacterium]|jgi:phosphoribosylamine--glycine ligase
MIVCVVGSGGREHALAQVLGRTADVIATPGNPGIAGTTAEGHTLTSVPTPAEEIDADLFVIGPEEPLVKGLADRLRAQGKLVFGPGADGARLEGSKAFMKGLLDEAGVPTARFGAFDDVAEAKAFLRSLPGPWVVKTDGLAAGKGVLVTDSLSEADADVEAKLSGAAFGDAGRSVVIEEGLVGEECSLLVLCDGTRLAALAPSQDFKRAADGDAGPNTGGMGAYSPVPFVDDALVAHLVDEAVAPLVEVLRARGIDYRGVLYAGLMLTPEGPKVLEYNVRFGDPETQVVLPRYDGDLASLLAEVAAGRLRTTPRFVPEAAVCVVLASEGYPESSRVGDPIEGLGDTVGPQTSVFHAGTRTGEAGEVVTAGGRVLGVTALGRSIEQARSRAYGSVARIGWPGMQHRTDIAAAPGRSGHRPASPDPRPTQEVSG